MSEIKTLTCIECPVGCEISVEINGDTVAKVSGNGCPRGAAYARNEVVCPRRVLTTTVRTESGKIVPVKTDKPVKKSEIFAVMAKVNACRAKGGARQGDVIIANITEDVNIIAADDEQ